MAGQAPRFLYFDLGNVLLHFDHRRAARQMAEVAGVPIEQVWKVVFEGDLEWRYERGELTAAEFYDQFCAATKSRPARAELEHAASAIFWLNAKMVPLVAQLCAAGYPLGILSNTNDAHWAYLHRRYRFVRDLFRITALSYELRAMKPEPAIYTAAAELAGVAPQEIFFVDDREDNLAGALQAGYDAVLYTDPVSLASELRQRGIEFNY